MRLITEDDLREFTDPDGDKLITLRKARKKDLDDLASLLLQMGVNADAKDMKALKGLNIAELNLFMLRRVARKLIIGGKEYTGEDLIKAYQQLDPESAAWVDKCIQEVWEAPNP